MQFNPILHKELLKTVSRSFFLSLNILPRTLRPLVGLGYLLCKTADSIGLIWPNPTYPIKRNCRIEENT